MEDHAKKITDEFIREFAELNLQLVQHIKKCGLDNVTPELLKELRENAQALRNLF